ncbi:hypothetical protein CEXT_414521 [Caerostris extrusa]|uniref:Uncharacterized protein n=1 Tax=Caerostris extrusa TaxID=172846 RepID=A0AAV4XNM9_CAEEX|nr:hypothetical protein CEXT_414521 [Caerostris extrusa]
MEESMDIVDQQIAENGFFKPSEVPNLTPVVFIFNTFDGQIIVTEADVDEASDGVRILPSLNPNFPNYGEAKDNLKKKIMEINAGFKDDIRIKLTGEYLRYSPMDIKQHRAIITFLHKTQMEYFSCYLKNQPPEGSSNGDCLCKLRDSGNRRRVHELGF